MPIAKMWRRPKCQSKVLGHLPLCTPYMPVESTSVESAQNRPTGKNYDLRFELNCAHNGKIPRKFQDSFSNPQEEGQLFILVQTCDTYYCYETRFVVFCRVLETRLNLCGRRLNPLGQCSYEGQAKPVSPEFSPEFMSRPINVAFASFGNPCQPSNQNSQTE